MKKITDFLRKIGVLHVSSGDYQSGEFDTKEDLKEKTENTQEQKENQEDHKHKGDCCSH